MPVKTNWETSPSYISGVVIKKVQTSDNLCEKIAHQRGIPLKKVKRMMQYNHFPLQAFSELTGMTVNNLNTRLRGHVRRNRVHYTLNWCDPYDSEYFKFIYRNEKCQELIEKSVGMVRMSKHGENVAALDS